MAKWVVCRIEIPQPGEIEALRVTDIDQDGKPEILLGIQGTVFVYRLEGQKLSEVTQMAVAQWQQIINISTLDINSDGQEEIIVSARFDNRGETRIFNFQDSEFREMARTSMLLARFEPIDRAPFLLGIDAHEFLMRDPQFYRVELKKKKLRKEAYPLPGADQPYGNASLAKKGGGIWLASLKADNHLVVRDARARLRWESGENYGGSIRGLKVFLQGKRNLDDFEMHYFHSRLKKTSRGTLLVSQHDGPGLFKNSPNYKKGRIVELSWNGATFDEVAETANLGGFVVDFDQYDLGHDNTDDIFAGLQYRQGGFFREPISGLVILSPH